MLQMPHQQACIVGIAVFTSVGKNRAVLDTPNLGINNRKTGRCDNAKKNDQSGHLNIQIIMLISTKTLLAIKKQDEVKQTFCNG